VVSIPLSYAQAMEDVVLAQVFRGEPAGTYIDIGGGHAVADNVTFWFYLAGWRGVVVEPQEHLHRAYAGLRPRDTALAVLVGASHGEADFHEVDRLHGFSTMVTAHAESAGRFGADFSTSRKPITTLARLCEEHALSRIDLLKIDVEGAEAEVLAGADFSRHRPRVIVVEAVTPGSMQPAWDSFEPTILAAGYRFCFFDGLNRFYVADEAAPLAARFPQKPLPWENAAHLFDFGRAARNRKHPDHALAQLFRAEELAELAMLPAERLQAVLLSAPTVAAAKAAPDMLRAVANLCGQPPMVGPSPWPRLAPTTPLADALAAIVASDALRAALGRICPAYDGGFIMEE
jgi:FkbM family methyltransferase